MSEGGSVMANATRLKDAANTLLAAVRDFIGQLEAEESAEGAVPATAMNMPPETRAQRPNEMREQAQAQNAPKGAGATSTEEKK